MALGSPRRDATIIRTLTACGWQGADAKQATCMERLMSSGMPSRVILFTFTTSMLPSSTSWELTMSVLPSATREDSSASLMFTEEWQRKSSLENESGAGSLPGFFLCHLQHLPDTPQDLLLSLSRLDRREVGPGLALTPLPHRLPEKGNVLFCGALLVLVCLGKDQPKRNFPR